MTSIARRGICLVLAAPSGAGKTAIADALLASEPDLRLSVSVTTRLPRPGEVEGVHYRFCDQSAFDRMVAAGELLEWARVLGRHCYGTPRAPVEQALGAGKDMVFDIDWQGHRQLRAALPGDVVGVFILPPSMAGWTPVCAAALAKTRQRSPGVCSWHVTRSAIGRNSTTSWSTRISIAPSPRCVQCCTPRVASRCGRLACSALSGVSAEHRIPDTPPI